jgi:hypothetical protein
MGHVIGWRHHDVSIRMGLNDKTSLLYPPICTPYLYVFTLTLLPCVYLSSFGHSTVFQVSTVVHFCALKFMLNICEYKVFFFLI